MRLHNEGGMKRKIKFETGVDLYFFEDTGFDFGGDIWFWLYVALPNKIQSMKCLLLRIVSNLQDFKVTEFNFELLSDPTFSTPPLASSTILLGCPETHFHWPVASRGKKTKQSITSLKELRTSRFLFFLNVIVATFPQVASMGKYFTPSFRMEKWSRNRSRFDVSKNERSQ